jgi:hypothetical protein
MLAFRFGQAERPTFRRPPELYQRCEGSGPCNRLIFEGGPWTHFAVSNDVFCTS